MPLLRNGDAFPKLDVPAGGGGTISLPGDFSGSWGVVLIFRGAWCPVCNEQLASFGLAKDALDQLGVKVVALSVDDEATSAGLAAKHHLSFPVGHSADANKIADATGAFTNHEPRYLQPTGFILAPNGSVMNAVYSSNAVGRLTAPEVAGFVGFVKSRMAADEKAAA